MLKKKLVKLTNKQMYGAIFGRKQSDKIAMVCACFEKFRHVGKVNYKNINYDVMECRDCKCYDRDFFIPRAVHGWPNIAFADNSWAFLRDSDILIEQKIYRVEVEIPADPIYKMVEVVSAGANYTQCVEMNQEEKIKYYEKQMEATPKKKKKR